MHSSIHSFIHSLIHSFIHSFIHLSFPCKTKQRDIFEATFQVQLLVEPIIFFSNSIMVPVIVKGLWVPRVYIRLLGNLMLTSTLLVPPTGFIIFVLNVEFMETVGMLRK